MSSIEDEICELERELHAMETSLGDTGVKRTQSMSSTVSLASAMEIPMSTKIAGGWTAEKCNRRFVSDNQFRLTTRWTHPKYKNHLEAVEIAVSVLKDSDGAEQLADIDINLLPAPDQPHIFVENEFDSLVTFCQETCNTALLFIMIEHLVVKFESRWATITSEEFRDQVTAKKSESGPFVYVVGGRRSGQPPLAELRWGVGFDPRSTNVNDLIEIKLTREGAEQAALLNFPEEFIASGGRCREWTPETHLRNVIKMASFQDC